MAIEITAKRKSKKIPPLTVVFNILLGIFFIFLLTYGALIYYQNKLDQELSETEAKLVRTPSEEDLEKEILARKKQIEDWNFLAENHPLPLKAFEFLQDNTHPNVWFYDFSLRLGQSLVVLEGRAESFEVLGQQISILKKQELVKNTHLSEVALAKEGGIDFTIQLTLDPSIFKF